VLRSHDLKTEPEMIQHRTAQFSTLLLRSRRSEFIANPLYTL